MNKIYEINTDIDNNVATGKSIRRPYIFEITRALDPLGFLSEVIDYYPAKDGSCYVWEAIIWKRHPQIISELEYNKITRSSCDAWGFNVEEIQEILIAHGYEIVRHIAKIEVIETRSDVSGEVNITGNKWIENVERILAVKPEDKENLPEWNDSGRAHYLSLKEVFNRLMKRKLSLDYEKEIDNLREEIENLKYKFKNSGNKSLRPPI